MIDQPKPSNPPGDDLHDVHIDALWRATRTEGLSPDIDATLRAAARREIGAGPVRTQPQVAEATRWERWWWPLAAAATIGAVAIGLLQLTPDERAEPAVVSDMPAPSAKKAEVIAAKTPASGSAESRADASPPAVPPAAPPAAQPAAEAKRDVVHENEKAPRPSQPRAADQAPERRREIDRVATPLERAEDKLASSPPQASFGNSEPAPASAVGLPPAPPPPPAPSLSPPPAPPSVRVPASSPASTPPPAAMPVPFPLGAAKDASGAPRTNADVDAAATGSIAASRAQSNGGAATAKQAAPLPVARAMSAPGAVAAGTGPAPAQLAKVAPMRSSADAAKPAALPADEWIALIRRLRDENKIDEAAKELAAFRAAHPDADRLLPLDLRDWRPPQAATSPP